MSLFTKRRPKAEQRLFSAVARAVGRDDLVADVHVLPECLRRELDAATSQLFLNVASLSTESREWLAVELERLLNQHMSRCDKFAAVESYRFNSLAYIELYGGDPVMAPAVESYRFNAVGGAR
jgi:hypothetical protein